MSRIKPSLPGNPHEADADNVEVTSDAYAIAQATLALAYEQRTANLLAFMATTLAHGQRPHRQIAEDLDARLGLKSTGATK